MTHQIIDIVEIGIAGPMGDVTPAALQALADAHDEADRSESEADRAEAARNQAEVFAGNIEELQDLAVAAIVGDDESASRDRLDRLYVTSRDRGERFMAALDQKRDAVLAVMSDSTAWINYRGTDNNEWPKQLAIGLGSQYATLGVTYQRLAGLSPLEYAPAETVSVPSHIVMHDKFDRTAGSLLGSTPNVGGVWTGITDGWELPGDGTAVFKAGSNVIWSYAIAAGHITYVFDVEFNSSGAGTLDLVTSRTSSEYYLSFRIDIAAGKISCYKRLGYSAVLIKEFTFAEVGISGGVTRQTFKVEHTPDGTLIFHVGEHASEPHELPSGENAALSTNISAVGIGTLSQTVAGAKLHSIEAISSSPVHSLDVYNAAMGSQNTFWSIANIETLLPVQPDLVIIAHNFNHGTSSVAVVQNAINDLVKAIRVLHGEQVGIIVASENPVFPDHIANVRNQVMREFCRVHNYGYAPTYEAFMHQEIPRDWVLSDGVHPTPAGIDLVGETHLRNLMKLSCRPEE